MLASGPAGPLAMLPHFTPRRDRMVTATVLCAAVLFLFADRHPMPIVLWDESRVMVNALEMHHAGGSLVTTFGGLPDLWNTKPPLLVWLMAASVSLFGASETALRLPSALAALGTTWLVLRFTRRVTGSIQAAAAAAALLVLSPGFFGEHGARTADYDALLTFFTTAYLMLLFEAVHRRRPAPTLLGAISLMVAAAVMTKSVAGLVPGAGVLLYLAAIRRRLRWPLRHMMFAIAMAAGPVLVFLLAREAAAPGYLHAAWHNDIVDRAGRSVVGEAKPANFYLTQLAAGYGAAMPLVALAAAALLRGWVHGRARLALVYSLAVTLTLITIVSAAQSKLTHYLLPALPFVAIATAIGAHAAVRSIGDIGRRTGRPWLLLLVTALVWPVAGSTARAFNYRYRIDPAREAEGDGRYARLGPALASVGAPVTIVDRGFTLEGRPHYVAVLRAYRLLWAANGMSTHFAPDPRGVEGLVASCDDAVVPVLARRGPDRAHVPGCVLVDLSRRTAAPAFRAAS